MDNAIYVSLSRQMVLQRSIEISANNVDPYGDRRPLWPRHLCQ
jgi:hypothetical protein